MLKNFLVQFLDLSRVTKRTILVSIDTIAVTMMLWAAFSVSLDVLYEPPSSQIWLFILSPLVAIPLFIKFGLYRAIVRYIGLKALWTIVQAVLLYSVIFTSLLILLQAEGVPRSIYILNAVFTMMVIGGSRMLARWFLNGFCVSEYRPLNKSDNCVIIYGAGSAGMQLSAALSTGYEQRPVAYVDDDTALQGLVIQGLRVYSFTDLSSLIEKYRVKEVLLALPSVSKKRKKEILFLLEPYPVHVRTIPSVSEMAQGKVRIDDIQEIDIGDLLGRDSVAPENNLLKSNIQGKSILVTGAGGSIGSELCRQIIKNKPTRLVLFELSEFQLYAIERELLNLIDQSIELVPILGSVTSRKRLIDVCQAFSVHTIYHAAAYKHVPMVERNPGEGVTNNIFGTLSCALAAIESNVETFVLISTDKAVRPTNTMGATKRFAELILQALSQSASLSKKTRFTMVRFGNVLGSSGSVVPLFREQIAQGGPVTVTDKKIIRYFMTIPEAAELVIQAGAMGKGGDVFVLDMGEPVSIVDLARRMIRLSGYDVIDDDSPNGDIEITYTGLRPGEKLYEELLIGDNVTTTEHAKIMRAEEEVIEWSRLNEMIENLNISVENGDFSRVREVLQLAVSGFHPQCEIADEITLALSCKVQSSSNVINL